MFDDIYRNGLHRIKGVYFRWMGAQLPVYAIADVENYAKSVVKSGAHAITEYWQWGLFGCDLCHEVMQTKDGTRYVVASMVKKGEGDSSD